MQTAFTRVPDHFCSFGTLSAGTIESTGGWSLVAVVVEESGTAAQITEHAIRSHKHSKHFTGALPLLDLILERQG
jgi:hypothetical protein